MGTVHILIVSLIHSTVTTEANSSENEVVLSISTSSASNTADDNRLEEVTEGDSHATTELNRRLGTKRTKSRAHQELADRIINFEDHLVDLELAALEAKIKCKTSQSQLPR